MYAYSRIHIGVWLVYVQYMYILKQRSSVCVDCARAHRPNGGDRLVGFFSFFLSLSFLFFADA